MEELILDHSILKKVLNSLFKLVTDHWLLFEEESIDRLVFRHSTMKIVYTHGRQKVLGFFV